MCTSTGLAAPDEGLSQEQRSAVDTNQIERALPGDVSRRLGRVDEQMTLNQGLQTVADSAGENIFVILKKAFVNVLLVFVLAVMLSIFNITNESALRRNNQFVYFAAACLIGYVGVTSSASIAALGKAAIDQVDLFSKALLPSLAATMAASGVPATAAVQNGAAVLFSGILVFAIKQLFLPLFFAYMAAIIANAAMPGEQLTKICDFIKWLLTWAMRLFLTVYVAYITLSGLISGNVDRLALQGARFALSGGVPVVGGIISDAAQAVMSGTGVLKNAIGIYGLVGVLLIVLVPAITQGTYYLLFKVVSAITHTVCDGKISKLLEDLAAGFGILLGLTSSAALVMIISIISALNAVTVM